MFPSLLPVLRKVAGRTLEPGLWSLVCERRPGSTTGQPHEFSQGTSFYELWVPYLPNGASDPCPCYLIGCENCGLVTLQLFVSINAATDKQVLLLKAKQLWRTKESW